MNPIRLGLAIALALAVIAPVSAAKKEPPKPRTMQEILEASTPADWRRLDPDNTLVMELPSGRVIIELAPKFAPEHVANIKTLVRAGYFDGLSINRSQDNFVVQWGDPNGGEKNARSLGDAKTKIPAEFSAYARNFSFTKLPDVDGWASQVGFSEGMPVGRDRKTQQAWIAHCYGTLGAGRDTAPDSSTGAELYVVSGQSPRQLDRNITTVGRVVQGMELLSVMPRGTGPLGFYEKPEQRQPITRIRLMADVPEAERAKIELLRTDSKAFVDLIEARRNRRDGWYVRPAGHIDLCNVPLPVRPIP